MTVVAIDFGTSNTVICRWDPVEQVPITCAFAGISRRYGTGQGSSVDVVPSLMFIQDQQHRVWGEAVRAQRLGAAQPERLFQGFKRDLVAEYVPPPRQLDGYPYTSETVAELFLQHIDQALQEQGIEPTQVIFTAPVGSFERYLNWLRTVAVRLSFPAIQIIDESTAAALGYAIDQPGSRILVVDFGGGTLDLSLVRVQAKESLTQQSGRLAANTSLTAEVIAKSDAYVGGLDIDIWIVEDYLTQSGSSRSQVGAVGWQNLLEVAERLKIQVSSQPEASEVWFDDETFTAHELRLTQDQLAELLESRQLLEQVRQSLDEVLLTAMSRGVSKSQIEQVLLVGGTSQIPAIQTLMTSYFGKHRVLCDKPFEAVAFGALRLGQLTAVEDYLRHSYAIRLWDPNFSAYTYFPLFEKGMKYPCEQTEPLVLQVASENQREIRLDIGEVADLAQAEVAYDGQGRMTSRRLSRQTDFRSLSGQQDPVCLARLDPAGKVGEDRIQVSFAVDPRRALLASVKDLRTGEMLVEHTPVAKLV